MTKESCFFCEARKEPHNHIISDKNFFAVFDDFPVSDGHCLIVTKDHITSFFNLSPEQVLDLHTILLSIKKQIEGKWKTDGFNIGINEGKAAGQTQQHLHIHIIPRYFGDVENQRGGVRNVIPGEADYYVKLKQEMPEREKYLSES